jgi:predicted Zn-dependent protease
MMMHDDAHKTDGSSKRAAAGSRRNRGRGRAVGRDRLGGGLRAWLAVLPAVVIAAGIVWGAAVLLQSGGGANPAGGGGGAEDPASLDSAAASAPLEKVLAGAGKALRAGEPGRALAILEPALEKLPGEQELHLTAAEASYAAGDVTRALRHMDQAIAIGPDHPEYRFAAGMYAEEAGELMQAELHLREAQRLEPANPKHPLYLAAVLEQSDQIEQSKATLLRVVRIDDSIAQAWAMLAELALRDGAASVGLQHIERARTLEPANPAWRVIHGRLLRRSNQPRAAADVLLGIPKAQLLGSAVLMEEVGQSLGMAGEAEEASRLYAEAARATPGDPEIQYRAAYWHDRVGDRAAAMGYAQQARALGHELAGRLLERLEREAAGDAEATPGTEEVGG